MGSPVGARLRDEDFDLTIVQIDSEDSILDDWAIGRVEDIADNFSLGEAGVRDVSMNLTIDLVCNGHEELATSESVDLVIDPLLSEVIVNNALRMSGSVHCLSEFEHVGFAVKVAP
jgi:2-hydroxy-3-keto-5-methylthiopentenyl-1-phosphate phosphatase